MSDNNSTSEPHSPYKTFVQLAVKSFFYTILWIPVYGVRCFIVKFVGKYLKSYGKILDHCDSTVEEDYTELPPKNSLVFTIVVEGDLTASQLKPLFTRNVLEARISSKDKTKSEDELRYPEFKQYQIDFAGFQFWRNDPTFNIDHHITEQTYRNNSSLRKIHQEMINKLFAKKRSPWEIVVYRNYENANKTLLVYRVHHTHGDTISQLKVLVESLGEKELQLPNVQYKEKNPLEKFFYYALMPFYFVFVQVRNDYVESGTQDSPWRFKLEQETLLNISISQKLSMADIKLVAKKNGVTTSAVIMSVIAGAVGKSDVRLKLRGIPCQYVLPKADHPPRLANHSYSGVMVLPSHVHSPSERLHKCNDIFLRLKSSDLHKYDKVVVFQSGTWFNPLRLKFLRNTTFPLIITNIASDREGFKIGSYPVSEFTMTCAPLFGACGVIITAFSYKDSIEFTITAKEGILTESQNEKLAKLMEKELHSLIKS
ncbi:hypothetical protein Ocin01_02198 [Orchesella cincta]|uniref:O-acyltransferase WSD1 C-terminal domain-containing protein n=1 Tax=Orchesella cincta TaxID=48709 RepID=A0A1D2NHA6_ORCCI|nr:hypothetical protein Ocin01_02198 [Orchesella cincta]